MNIKQIVISADKLLLGLGEDNQMYVWANEDGWQPYGWTPKPPRQATIVG